MVLCKKQGLWPPVKSRSSLLVRWCLIVAWDMDPGTPLSLALAGANFKEVGYKCR